jgi:hypothetical protein
MVMVTAIWVAVVEVIITDGLEVGDIITAGGAITTNQPSQAS